MGRRKAPKDIRHRREQAHKKHIMLTSRAKRRWWKLPLESLGILSAIAGVLTLIPRLSLDISDSRQPRSPMSTVFALTNDGLLSVHDVNVICGVEKVKNAFGGGIQGIGFSFPTSHTDTLSPAQKVSLPCDQVVDMGTIPTQSARMTISVVYRPDWVWWHLHIAFHLEAQKRDDGTWLWRRIPN